MKPSVQRRAQVLLKRMQFAALHPSFVELARIVTAMQANSKKIQKAYAKMRSETDKLLLEYVQDESQLKVIAEEVADDDWGGAEDTATAARAFNLLAGLAKYGVDTSRLAKQDLFFHLKAAEEREINIQAMSAKVIKALRDIK